ncbi:MAG: carbon-nitrogen hydrolase family protein [Motiliproteus sp.]|nr:carbon-nitrogen hydrolase family protein [Motiliproteus sp.]MCW9050993.1 carbon-nitrogen hydrolase family protein [Motiliproteus sp.]
MTEVSAKLSKVAVVQMVSGDDWQHNLGEASQLIGEAAGQGAELVLLPENFAVFNASQLLERGRQEQTADGPIRRFLSQQAKIQGIWLVGGSLPVLCDDGQRVRAACFVYDSQGVERARYDKLHLFDVDVEDKQSAYRESEQIEPGDRIVVVDTPVGRLGLSICYDLRFPLLYQAMMDQGAELISVPAAFTQVTGQAHWELLLRARAAETQCFILASNQGGMHNERRQTYGHSMIIDPWGVVLTQLVSGPGVLVTELDLEVLQEIRRKMPIQQHRRDPQSLR